MSNQLSALRRIVRVPHLQQWDYRLVLLLIIALVVPLLTPNLKTGRTIQELELLAYDWHCRNLPAQKPDPRIVIVAMDDDSLPRLPAAPSNYPLPRAMHAQLLDTLRDAGARVVGFDVMFIGNRPDDEVFARALRRHRHVIAAARPESRIIRGEEAVTFTKPAARLQPHLVASSILLSRDLGRARWLLPYPVDAETGERFPHLAMALAAHYYGDGAEQPRLVGDEKFRFGRLLAPLGAANEILIRFVGPPDTFKPVPYHDVFNDTWKQTHGRDFFRDKIVLVGRWHPVEDRWETPMGNMQGVEIHAHALQMALRRAWLRHWSRTENYLTELGLCLLLALALWQWGLWLAIPLICGVALLWVALNHLLFIHWGIWADLIEPLAALSITGLAATILEARRMRRVFHRLVPSMVADRLLLMHERAPASTEVVEASVVFCDVRNYTSLAETLPSELTEQLLREYFTNGETAARQLGTELDKFVGDEIMLWVVERRQRPRRDDESHGLRAVRWALAMQQAAQAIDRSGRAGAIGFRIGVGIASGAIRIGTIGGEQRVQHTVIGDAVNTASRLQTATKELGRGIVIAESTRVMLGEFVEVEPLGEVRVRGKQEAVKVYYPLSARPRGREKTG